jgi:hypothetical protein
VKLSRILIVPLIALDVMGNMLIGGSWKNTLSAVAWKNRNRKYLGWCHKFIDGLPWFGAGHCETQAQSEDKYGSVWAAWRAQVQEP